MSENPLDVVEEALVLDPDDRGAAVAGLDGGALDGKVVVLRAQLGLGSQPPEVAQPRDGRVAGFEQGQHQTRLLFVGATEQNAEPIGRWAFGDLHQGAETVWL